MASSATFVTSGYGQVEPNHLSAQRTSQIYAQLPLKSTITQIENGQFAKYDYATGEVNFSGSGEWLICFNEVKNYDVRHGAKDFVMSQANNSMTTIVNYVAGTGSQTGAAIPRLLKTNVNDIITTNCITATEAPAKGSLLSPGATGILAAYTEQETPDPLAMVWQVVKADATMPDGQPAVKILRIR